jgi:outer membrane protein OmpA-like peptidoglycan-associated protein
MSAFRFLALALGALLAGCAVNPPANQALEQARASLAAAQSDPHVPRFAAPELDLAARSLAEAERAWQDGGAAELVSHRAYIAEQRARIAREAAATRATEAEIAQAREARRASLEARAKEAEAARERAEALARESQQKLQALEQARRAEQAKRLASTEELASEVRRLEAEVPQLLAREGESGWVLTVGGSTLFDAGEATLRPEGRRAAESLAQVLRKHPERNVLIESFTDEGGGDDLNRRLSERRAQAVRNALVLSGVDAARIVARGMGNAFPVAGTPSRMEIVIAREATESAAGVGR